MGIWPVGYSERADGSSYDGEWRDDKMHGEGERDCAARVRWGLLTCSCVHVDYKSRMTSILGLQARMWFTFAHNTVDWIQTFELKTVRPGVWMQWRREF